MRHRTPAGIPRTASFLPQYKVALPGNKRSRLWLSPANGDPIFRQGNQNVKGLKLMLMGLTFLSAASPRAVARLAKDAETRMLGAHEIQATLRESGYGKFYAMTLNVPNVNSAGGSWVMHYVELKDAEKPGDLVAPVAIQEVDPGYPLELMKEKVQGTVVLSAVIRSDGSVGEVCILRGVDDRLDAYASAALSRWRFRPATRNGDPTALQTVVTIPFRPMRKLGF
jgi:TonB family protein